MKKIMEYVLKAGSDCIDTFGGDYVGGIHLQQIPDEITPCVVELKKHNIKSLLEIGSASGGNIALLNHFLDLDSVVIVDDNLHGKSPLRKEITKNAKPVEIIGDSHSSKILSSFKKVASKFDLMIIDGDHSYNGVKQDFKDYTPFLNDGGVLMFHDTIHWSTPGVKRFVGELKNKKGFSLINEYISETHVHACGIALFKKESETK